MSKAKYERQGVYSVRFELGADIWYTSNSRLSWQAKASKTKQVRELAGWRSRLAQAKQELPPERPAWSEVRPCDLLVEVAYPVRAGRVDPANASPMVKAILDGMVDAGVFADDNSRVIETVAYMAHDKKLHGAWHAIIVHIRDASETPAPFKAHTRKGAGA